MRLASVLLLILCLGLFNRAQAQTTTNCLDVESILVNACGPIEGYNEMVRVLVGPNPLTVSSLSGSWPNFGFDPWVMNATTANKTASLNATITTCGFLLEPLNGIIPANKKFIIVPSYMIDVNQNTFDGLTDTLYIIYQNSLDATGRFANTGSGTRTLTLTYPGCTNETATYAPGSLQNTDGARVIFDIAGNPTYSLGGCTAPITPFAVDAGPSPAAVCPGNGTVTLNGAITGTANYQQWSGGTGTFSSPNTTTTNYTLAPGQTTSFWLYFKAKGACADTLKDSVLINIQQQNPVSITANGPLSICTGDNLTLTASGGGSSYQWVGGPATAQYTINTPGTYTVQSSDACYNYQQSVTVTTGTPPTVNINQANTSLCPGQTLTATATGNGTIAWLPGPVLGSTITITAPGQYIAGVTNGCGTATDTLIVTAGTAPSVQITTAEPATVCTGNQLTLTATGNGPLTWTPGGAGASINISAAGTYTVSTSNSCGTATDNITVTAATPPSVQISNAEPVSVCPGQTLTLTASGNGNLTWSNGPTGNTSPITTGGTYTVTASNDCGSASDAITVTAGIAPDAQILTSGPITVCPNTHVTLNGTGAGNLNWSNGSSNSSTTVTQPGTYLLVSQTACGADTASITVNNYTLDAAFTADPLTGYAPLNVQTTNGSTGETGSTWVFGDGVTSSEDSPAHTYEQAGSYTLLLAVADENGCTDTASVEINVAEELVVELPNIFTPNGDQLNDGYKIKALGVTSMRGEIYNRWGEKMFTWNDPDMAWNGKSPLGAKASNGVYMCVVEAVDSLGKTHVFKTTVTLIQ